MLWLNYLSFSYGGPLDSGFQPHHRKSWAMILLLQNYLKYWKTHHCRYKFALIRKSFLLVPCFSFHKRNLFKTYIKLLGKITLPSLFKCNPFSNKISAQMLLFSINPKPFNSQTRFRKSSLYRLNFFVP